MDRVSSSLVERATFTLLAVPLLAIPLLAQAQDKPMASDDLAAGVNTQSGVGAADAESKASTFAMPAVQPATMGFVDICTFEPVGPEALVMTGDDAVLEVTDLLPADSRFTFFGVHYGPGQPGGGIFVNANGSITFGNGDTNWSESLEEFATTVPKLAAFWDDLNPGSADSTVTVEFKHLPDRLVATWNQVPEWPDGGSNTFQITLLFAQGVYQFLYAGMTATDGLVGISSGRLVESDLSAQPGFLAKPLGYLAELYGGAPDDPFDLDGRCILGAPTPAANSWPTIFVR